MKRIFTLIREERPVYEKYIVMLGINIFFWSLLSIPAYIGLTSQWIKIIGVTVNLMLFCFSLLYGFLSAEIAGDVFLMNFIFALFGGIYGAFIGDDIMNIVNITSGFAAYVNCVWYFLRYSAAAFFVSLIIKNTR